ncbi:RrF2 family transcriptional regulator [Calditrichota bacterium]
MILSQTWRYAVRALIRLAQHGDKAPVLSSTIAEEEDIPAPFLVKILGMLANSGLINSTRGPRGGFWLNRKPDTITLMEIARATGYFGGNDACLLGYGLCSDGTPCAIHEHWAGPLEHISDFLENTTLEDLAHTMKKESKTAVS